MTENYRPRLALDMYVLEQGLKTGIHRVCDELFPRIAKSPQFRTTLAFRNGGESTAWQFSSCAQTTAEQSRLTTKRLRASQDILLSPFGVAPPSWLEDRSVLHAHIVYDLIAIKHPEFFTHEAAAEVASIIDSLDDDTEIFAISNFTKQDLLSVRPDLAPQQITVIPLAAGSSFQPNSSDVDRAAMRRKYQIPVGLPYVLSVATLEVRKNLEQVVSTFAEFLDENPHSNLHLVLAGMKGWKLEKFESALSESRWRDRIIITGFVDEEDLSALYSDALCFIYMSLYEGFGLPPLEAMSCGTPVICSANSSLPEVVGDAGLLIVAEDKRAVRDAFRSIVFDAELRRSLSERGLARSKLFNWDVAAQLVVERLAHAHQRHLLRPINLPPRGAWPGSSVRKTRSVSGANIANLDVRVNGSIGPSFSVGASRPHGERNWPMWSDRLQSDEGLLAEGGRRLVQPLAKLSSNPLVSYVTIVRNNAATLSRAIESVRSQTYPLVEHVILDGASTDDTLQVIRRYDREIDYYASAPDTGLYNALNKIIPLARGELICVLNSDDWLEPDAAKTAVNRISTKSGANLLLTAARVETLDGPLAWPPAFVHPGSYFKCANVCHNGIYATRSAYEASGPYDETLKIAADFQWIMDCLEAGVQFVYTNERTINFSLGGVSGNVRAHRAECMQILARRFGTLSEAEIKTLSDIFFVFRNAVDESEMITDRDLFVRESFVRHGADRDLLNVLAWALVDQPQHHLVGAAPFSNMILAAKILLRDRLLPYPRFYMLAKSAFRYIRRRP
ncbi:D-inositol 3-phosphate glycosyltransferase [Variibacter gotjawalensis]|uniref:D-inositol 3-phosphate glycosyltransferase n=1 Tax=Variibacter gotjawalensis TaxID=1333996 RepID=A0A0S3PNT8_9BRAD|nr:glycosyltransferase [Variibacter gotjawalensis]NIK47898.1 glycosyltransferase involved in cell wall biosynthesis [Variibacter gotjawalensis]RZS49777.1 glycosyltransferase involved in cell wall biosynthesis [Variibacter gotjawalensis]BAT57605.1 D-inositol 3-phosphate glycosyltransferase [Variibacter gotjawalensis]